MRDAHSSALLKEKVTVWADSSAMVKLGGVSDVPEKMDGAVLITVREA